MNFSDCKEGMEVVSSVVNNGIVYKIIYLNTCSETVDVEVVRSPGYVNSNGMKYFEVHPDSIKLLNDICAEGLYIGNSLSFCIQDILSGKIREDQVVCIISSISNNWIDMVFQNNYETYWRQFDKDKAEMLLYRLWPRIVQPRNWGMNPNISGHDRWIKANLSLM